MFGVGFKLLKTHSKYLVPKEHLEAEQLLWPNYKGGIGGKMEEMLFIANHHWG